jgi:hypothetical protein
VNYVNPVLDIYGLVVYTGQRYIFSVIACKTGDEKTNSYCSLFDGTITGKRP